VPNYGASTTRTEAERAKFVQKVLTLQLIFLLMLFPATLVSALWLAMLGLQAPLIPQVASTKVMPSTCPLWLKVTNPGREIEKTYLDYRDEGDAESVDLSGVKDITFNGNNGNVGLINNGDNIILNNVDKAWIYTTTGQVVKHISNATDKVSIANLAPGIYIVKMQNGKVIRSAKLIKK